MTRAMSNFVIAAAIALAGCAAASDAPPVAQQMQEAGASLLHELTAAFNEGDTDRVLSHLADDFEHVEVTEEGTTVEIRGHDALRKALKNLFARHDSVEMTIEAVLEAGPYVAVRETVRRHDGDRMEGDTSLTVYEIRDGEIVRAWHYPPYRMMMAMP